MNESHPVHALWCDPAHGIAARIARLLEERGLHAARCVVLVPYAQLMNVAQDVWAQCGPAGFSPRFETTRNWALSAGGFVPTGYDIAFDMARDLVTAQSLLSQSGLAAERFALAGRVVELAMQLAPLAAAQLPDERAAWAQRAARVAEDGAESDWFRTESALIGVAVAWAAASGYATDVLLGDAVRAQVDGLIVLEGFQLDPLTQKLGALWGERTARFPLASVPDAAVPPHAALYGVAAEPEDEAEWAAACVLRHLAEGRVPVALVATDRALTRRISAQLAAQGVSPHDETGWKLSTTRAAATLMSALRACAHDAASDAVLDWLKTSADVDGPTVQTLEARLRRDGLREWPNWCARAARSEKPQDTALRTFTEAVEARRTALAQARPLPAWLRALRELLQAGGQWTALADDLAGAKVIAALWLDATDASDFAAGHHTLTEFTGWVRDVLEAASFVPPTEGQVPQVVVLPLHQLLGRAFGAVVIPACDDRHLPASPEPPGRWSAAQRVELGLPSREVLEVAQRAAWAAALRQPSCDLLWRACDASGEPVRPSPLVQALLLDHAALPMIDPRDLREVALQPTLHPTPSGALLPLKNISTSAYEDLRRCPYRFFALRQLGLRGADELDAEVDKRDFGNWLHAVLGHFHEALKEAPTPDLRERLALISIAEQRATREAGLSGAEFLPFAAAWPAVRDGYLEWLAGHEAEGNTFVESEPWKEQPLGSLKLVGRLDRVDRTLDGRAFVIDYKTESLAVSKERVKDPTEDTQLAFYAALMHDDTLRAAYVNVGEKSSGTHTIEQPAVVEARDALIAGLIDDFTRIGQGAPLPALGEGKVCEHCDARGLCRKDFWGDEAPAVGGGLAAADDSDQLERPKGPKGQPA